jgi:hypothetical protein
MPATGTIRFLDGAETGGLVLATSTVGSPTVVGSIASPAGASGAFHYRVNSAVASSQFRLPLGYGSGGEAITVGLTDNFFLIGFAFRVDDKTPDAHVTMCTVFEDGSAGICAGVQHRTNGDLVFFDSALVGVDTATDPLTLNQWHYIEIAFQHSATGAWEWWIDGVSQGTGTSDFLNGATDNPLEVRFAHNAAGAGSNGIWDWDDIYVVSHSSALSSLYTGASAPEVLPYQGRAQNSTSDWTHTNWAAALDDSDDANDLWDDSGETPLVSATWSGYSASGIGGLTDFDTAGDNGGHDGGPSGGAYTVDGTVQGAMWAGIYRRGNGGGTDHLMGYGNSGMTKSSAPSNFTMAELSSSADGLRVVASDTAGDMPTSSQTFSMGGRTTGARDIQIREQWAFLLHSPAAAAATPSAPTIVSRAVQRAATW